MTRITDVIARIELIPKSNPLICLRPSIEAITVREGVITPSAINADAPIIATRYNHFVFIFLTKENNAKIPPSPLLSALREIRTYLMVVCSVSVQIIQESAPSMYSSEIILASFPDLMMALITYNGEVPISPKTIPNETKTPMKVNFLVSK